MFTNWRWFLFVSINAFVDVAASVTNISCITQVTLKFINYTLLVNSGWLDFSNFKVFVECSSGEHRLNGGLDFWAGVCEMFFHYISRDLIFKWYDNSDGGCSHVGWWNVLLVCYLGIYELLTARLNKWFGYLSFKYTVSAMGLGSTSLRSKCFCAVREQWERLEEGGGQLLPIFALAPFFVWAKRGKSRSSLFSPWNACYAG